MAFYERTGSELLQAGAGWGERLSRSLGASTCELSQQKDPIVNHYLLYFKCSFLQFWVGNNIKQQERKKKT